MPIWLTVPRGLTHLTQCPEGEISARERRELRWRIDAGKEPRPG